MVAVVVAVAVGAAVAVAVAVVVAVAVGAAVGVVVAVAVVVVVAVGVVAAVAVAVGVGGGMTAQELIEKVLELDAKATKGPYSTRGEWIEYQIGNTKGIGVIASAGMSALKDKQKDINVECLAHYRTAAPILAHLLQKAIELCPQIERQLDEVTT